MDYIDFNFSSTDAFGRSKCALPSPQIIAKTAPHPAGVQADRALQVYPGEQDKRAAPAVREQQEEGQEYPLQHHAHQ